jgi:hypothetical protein
MPAQTSDTTKTARFALTAAESRVMARIFQHPLSHNLTWRETLALFDSIGDVDHAHNGDLILVLGRETHVFRPAHGTDLSADDIMALRHFLARAGWADGAAPAAAPQDHDQMVVLDRAEARVYDIPLAGHARATLATHHLTHDIDRSAHDANRDETYPADTAFFQSIADAIGPLGGVVLISHGKGQSNEAAHFIAYLDDHDLPLRGRIMANLTADLSHITMAQCLDLARAALADSVAIGVI